MTRDWIANAQSGWSAVSTPRWIYARAVLIGLGTTGKRALKRVAGAVEQLSPEYVPLLRFVAPEPDFANWGSLALADLAEMAIPAFAEVSRGTVREQWQRNHSTVRSQLVPIAQEVMELQTADDARSHGRDLFKFMEIHLIGDICDSLCNVPLLLLARELRRFLEPDIPVVIIAWLTVSRRNDTSLSKDAQAMAYAALRELNASLVTEGANPAAGVLDHCYVVDRVIEGDAPAVLRNADMAAEMIGGALAALLLSNVRNEASAFSLFRPRWREDREENDLRAQVGQVEGLGYVALRWPLHALISYCGVRERQRLVRESLLGDTETNREVLEPPSSLLRELALAPNELRNRLLRGVPPPPTTELSLDDVPTDQRAFRLRLAQEDWEGELLPAWTRQLEASRNDVRQAAERALRVWIDRVVQSEPRGWCVVEQNLESLDQRLRDWAQEIASAEPVQDLESADRQLRSVVSHAESRWAYGVHSAILLALVLWLGLTTALGWIIGLFLSGLGVFALWQQSLGSEKRAQDAARIAADRVRARWSAMIENALRVQMRTIYREVRSRIGFDPPVDPDSEMAAIQHWRNVLSDALNLLTPDAEAALRAVERSYGDWAVLNTSEELERYYTTHTAWTSDSLTADFLRGLPPDAVAPWWRNVTPGDLADQVQRFCQAHYQTLFHTISLDVESTLEFLGRASARELEDLVRQLKLRSEPLLSRGHLYSDGSGARLSFLLVGNPATSHIAQQARETILTPVTSFSAGFLAAVQIECNVPLSELTGLQRLRSFYDELSEAERSQIHILDDWDQLPHLPGTETVHA